jgi:hypothetical protein
MAGFVMFSHCKLLQAQSQAVAKAEHEDQLSNGNVPGALCRHAYLTAGTCLPYSHFAIGSTGERSSTVLQRANAHHVLHEQAIQSSRHC